MTINTPATDDGLAAVYAFAGWLTSQEGAMMIGAKHDAAPMAEAIRAWVNKFGAAYSTNRQADAPRKQTSEIVSTIAGKYLHFGLTDLLALGASDDLDALSNLVTHIRALAASALSQDETA